jgi:hypothetical protein
MRFGDERVAEPLDRPEDRGPSPTRLERLASETKVFGQSCSWISDFETARGRLRIRSSRSSNAFGETGTAVSFRNTSRVSESNAKPAKLSRIFWPPGFL